jgi:hypothetical protein
MEWITVKERLPDWNQEILVSFQSKDISKCDCTFSESCAFALATYVKSQFLTFETSRIVTPTHWMPLPKAPDAV